MPAEHTEALTRAGRPSQIDLTLGCRLAWALPGNPGLWLGLRLQVGRAADWPGQGPGIPADDHIFQQVVGAAAPGLGAGPLH